jgi:HlyD family secretion protein
MFNTFKNIIAMSGMDKIITKKSKFNIKNIGIFLVGVLLIALIFVFLSNNNGSKLNVEYEKISIEKVENGLFQDYIALIGMVEPIQTIYLDATEGGRVDEICIREGVMVNKGDIIMKLSNDNLLLEISSNEADVARAINDLKTMKVNLENQNINNKTQLIDYYYDLLKLQRAFNHNQKLFQGGHIAKEEFEISKENLERTQKHYDLLLEKAKKDSVFLIARLSASEESVESMQQNLKIVRNRLSKLTVKAPVNGELAKLSPEVGEVINYGTRIGTINILDSYKLKVEVDEHFISRVTKGLKGECEFSELNFPVQITKVYPEVLNGRFAVDMEFTSNIPSGIRIGQTTRIRLELGESKNAILLPKGGFYQSTGGQWVYKVDKSGTLAKKQNIRIGRQNPNFYEILDGLSPGDQVITSGYENYGDADVLIIKK